MGSSAAFDDVYEIKGLKVANGMLYTSKTNVMISRWFENFILFVIVLNTILLILDNPLEDPEGTVSKVLSYFDIIFTVIFTIEAIMKIVAMGFFWNSFPGLDGYIMNGWNILDFLIV